MRISAAFFFLGCFSLSGLAQAATPSAQAPSSTQASVAPTPAANHRISLDVVVTDKVGNPQIGLQQQDFTLLDENQPRTITSFHASEPTPEGIDREVQLILVLDAVNAGLQSLQLGQSELKKFLQQNESRLAVPTSLVLFTDQATQIQPVPTRDGNSLADFLSSNPPGMRVVGRSGGFAGAADRLQMSIRMLEELAGYEQSRPGRKMLIWISPGWPLLSGPRMQLNLTTEEMFFHTVVSLSKGLREARLILYDIDPLGMTDAASGQTVYYKSFLKGVTSVKK